jgi:Lycopene cyclase
VSSAYIGRDMVATHWGEWSFNAPYISGVRVVNLPLEEILFFITVPDACLFIYEAVLTTSRKRSWSLPIGIVAAAIVILVPGSVAYLNQGYTSKALASCAVFLLIALWLSILALARHLSGTVSDC